MPLFVSQVDIDRISSEAYRRGKLVGEMTGYMDGWRAATRMADVERKLDDADRRITALKG